MGKILIVEPSRILQQAISAALVTEHEVESREVLEAPELEAVKDYDLVVIDGAAVKDDNDLTHALRSSKAPVLWLQTEELSSPLRQDQFASLKMPLERGLFLSAVSELLSGKPAPKSQSPGDKKSGSQVAAPGKQLSQPGDQANSDLIDLVDIVEQKENSPERKSQ
ncbi:MAG: hypothetical protein ACREQK_05765 [Candidatus Binatia bacterium]